MNLILHADEIFLKGSNQPFFYRRLIKNLSELFPGAKIKRVESGLWAENFNQDWMNRLSLVPGIANFASAVKGGNGIAEINKNISILLSSADTKGKTFRITCERSYKNYPLPSVQVEKETGRHVCASTGMKVDLTAPNINIHVSIGKNDAIIYGNTADGAGGLPTGSSGKILCLISGGIDSPVAAYTMMRRGAEIGLVHFQNQTSVSAEVGQKIIDLAKTLAKYQPQIELFMVPFARLQKEIVMKVPSTHRMIVSRRLFYKIGDRLAKTHGYQALASGDSLGQVASQTLENMNIIYSEPGMLKLAPLVGMNKKEITAISRRLGAFDISSRPYEDCCSLFLARHPATKARPEDAEKYAGSINADALDKKDIISYHISNN